MLLSRKTTDCTNLVYEVAGLPGAVYDVIADEDIYTGDGTLRAEKDTVVETLTTGEDGTAKSGSLYLGRYRLEERQAPSGCALNPQPEYVELTYAGETIEVTQTAAGLYDERQKVDVTLFKAMETDDLFGLGMNEEYKDISFGLYASADLTAADETVTPAGGLLEVVSVSSEESWRLQRFLLLPTCLLAAIMSRNAQPTALISFRIRNIRLSLSMLVRKPPWYRSLSMKARLFPMNFSVGV